MQLGAGHLSGQAEPRPHPSVYSILSIPLSPSACLSLVEQPSGWPCSMCHIKLGPHLTNFFHSSPNLPWKASSMKSGISMTEAPVLNNAWHTGDNSVRICLESKGRNKGRIYF